MENRIRAPFASSSPKAQRMHQAIGLDTHSIWCITYSTQPAVSYRSPVNRHWKAYQMETVINETAPPRCHPTKEGPWSYDCYSVTPHVTHGVLQTKCVALSEDQRRLHKHADFCTHKKPYLAFEILDGPTRTPCAKVTGLDVYYYNSIWMVGRLIRWIGNRLEWPPQTLCQTRLLLLTLY